VIGVVSQLTRDAYLLGMGMGRADLARTDDEYEPLRELITTGLQGMELDAIELPEGLEEYVEVADQILQRVAPYLSAQRGRLLGDTTALPVFFLSFFATRAAGAMAFQEPLGEYGDLIETTLEDLGLGRDFLRVLERYAGFAAVQVVDGEEIVSTRSITLAANSFLEEALEQLIEQGGADELRGLVKDLTREVRAFRDEFRDATAQLETLVREGNASVTAAIAEVEALLVANGMDPAKAAALTEDDPATFWDRTLRWFGGAGPRDAAEAAFWAALDFVPGGIGVKVGIKVAQAIRGSLRTAGGGG
jgi:hypothetical protein